MWHSGRGAKAAGLPPPRSASVESGYSRRRDRASQPASGPGPAPWAGRPPGARLPSPLRSPGSRPPRPLLILARKPLFPDTMDLGAKWVLPPC